MFRLVILFCLTTVTVFSQSIADCRKRFDTYLNFRGSLNGYLSFEKDAIYLLNEKGIKEYAFYVEELPALASFFANSSFKQQETLIAKKKLTRYNKRQRDSLMIFTDDHKPYKHPGLLPLGGYRIAIDPGHFSTNLNDAKIEQKYLYFLRDSLVDPTDTVKLFESQLTFTTAQHLKIMLERQGAQVFLTRSQSNFTSFNCTWTDWLTKHKKRHLDSLQKNDLDCCYSGAAGTTNVLGDSVSILQKGVSLHRQLT